MKPARVHGADGGEPQQENAPQPPQNGDHYSPSDVLQSPAANELPAADNTGGGNGGQPSASPAPAAPGEIPTGFSAADLVAQLSQSGTSAQMLLDALAALPKVGLLAPLLSTKTRSAGDVSLTGVGAARRGKHQMASSRCKIS